MLTLGFDTTVSTLSVALIYDASLIEAYDMENQVTHSTTLLPAIDELLKHNNLKLNDINLISVSAGPGSFTGVRIGVSTAKGLTASNGIPTVGVSSLESLAYPLLNFNSFVLPVIGARRGNVYAALFKCGNGSVERLTDDDLIPIDRLAEYCQKQNIDSVCVVGDEAENVCRALKESNFNTNEPPKNIKAGSGFGAALAGYHKFREYPDDDYNQFSLKPVYLRKSQAEREREEKLGLCK